MNNAFSSSLREIHRPMGRALVALVVILFAGCSTDSSRDVRAELDGVWHGYALPATRSGRLVVEITANQDGTWEGKATTRLHGHGVFMLALEGTFDADGAIRGKSRPHIIVAEPFKLEGRLENRTIELTELGRSPTRLAKIDQTFALSDAPRVDASGDPVLGYSYQVPKRLDDGWKTASAMDHGFDATQVIRFIEQLLAGAVPRLESVLVARRGELVLEEYFYGKQRDELHPIASVTKSVASMLFGVAIKNGVAIDLDEHIHDILPSSRTGRWLDERYPIKLRHVLTMSAGLDWDEITLPYSDPTNPAHKLLAAPDPIDFVLDLELKHTPGTVFAYNSGLSILLGEVLHQKTGLEAEDFAQAHLFEPLGIKDVRWSAGGTGGGVALRERDLLKLGQLILQSGRWNGVQVMSKSWIEDSAKPHIAISGGNHYGYQWWLWDAGPIKLIRGIGNGGQQLIIAPEVDLVIVMTASNYEGLPASQADPLEALLEGFVP